MSNLQSHIPFILSSMYRGPTILNMAGTDDEEEEKPDAAADAPDDGESADDDDTPDDSESQNDEDDSDESEDIDEETPAGKAFAKERAKRKAAEKKANLAQETAQKALDAVTKLTETLSKPKPEETVEEEEVVEDIAPEDEAVIERYLKKKGIDPSALKNLPQNVQRDQMERQIDKVCTALEKKYVGSVPFDRDKVLKYAVDNGFAAAMPNAPLERVLELAHKEMNEDAFLDYRAEARKKKKDAPTPSGSGTGKKKIVEDQPDSVSGFRNRARSRVGSDD